MEGKSSTPSYPREPKRALNADATAQNSDQGNIAENSLRADNKDKNDEGKKGRNKGYRPGVNSYLKVVLDDVTMDRLHQCAVQLRHRVLEMSQETQEVNAEETVDESKSKRKRELKFKPRSRTSLHTTFFFGGEVLCELPPEELEEWHANIADRLKASNFKLMAADASSVSDEKGNGAGDSLVGKAGDETVLDKEYRLTLSGFSLFPPRRNNLIVALLEASPAWHALHDDLQNIARDGNSEALVEIVKRSKKRWTPHITLGNLYGGRKKDLRELNTILETFSATSTESLSEEKSSEQSELDDMTKLKVHKIAMGGPVPEQVKLDWDFVFDPQAGRKAC